MERFLVIQGLIFDPAPPVLLDLEGGQMDTARVKEDLDET